MLIGCLTTLINTTTIINPSQANWIGESFCLLANPSKNRRTSRRTFQSFVIKMKIQRKRVQGSNKFNFRVYGQLYKCFIYAPNNHTRYYIYYTLYP